jgi:hypothetical protein
LATFWAAGRFFPQKRPVTLILIAGNWFSFAASKNALLCQKLTFFCHWKFHFFGFASPKRMSQKFLCIGTSPTLPNIKIKILELHTPVFNFALGAKFEPQG